MLGFQTAARSEKNLSREKAVVRWFGGIRKGGGVSCSNTLDLSLGKFLKTHINPASYIESPHE